MARPVPTIKEVKPRTQRRIMDFLMCSLSCICTPVFPYIINAYATVKWILALGIMGYVMRKRGKK